MNVECFVEWERKMGRNGMSMSSRRNVSHRPKAITISPTIYWDACDFKPSNCICKSDTGLGWKQQRQTSDKVSNIASCTNTTTITQSGSRGDKHFFHFCLPIVRTEWSRVDIVHKWLTYTLFAYYLLNVACVRVYLVYLL